MSPSRRYLSGLFLAVVFGYFTLHVVVAAYVGELGSSWFAESDWYEGIRITAAGEPLIYRQWQQQGQYNLEYLTLDRQPALEPTEFASSSNLLGPIAPAGWTFQPPERWDSRIAGFHDRSPTRPTFWYLIVPESHGRDYYFVGYDHLTARRIGYLGRTGFSPELPAPDQRFQVGTLSGDYVMLMGSVASNLPNWRYANTMQPLLQARSLTATRHLPEARIWCLTGEVVYEINLLERTATPLLSLPGAVSLVDSRLKNPQDGLERYLLLLRTTDGVVVFDPHDRSQTRLPLPPSVRGRYDSFAQTTAGEYLLMRTTYSPGDLGVSPEHTYEWYSPTGTLLRDRTFQLTTRIGQPSMTDYLMAVVFPIPAIGAGSFVVAPLFQAWEGSGTYWRNLKESPGSMWAFLLINLLIGLIVTWACRRREDVDYQQTSWLVPCLVGLCGWPGWVAYHVVRPPRTKLADGRPMPRRPEPAPPLGYEVFA